MIMVKLWAYLQKHSCLCKRYFSHCPEAVADFLEAEMKLSNGLFASALDADSATPEAAREEGGYYTWTGAELDNLELEQRTLFNDYFDITPYSAWEGKYILRTNSLAFHCKNGAYLMPKVYD